MARALHSLESPMALRLIIEDFEGSTTIVPLEQDPVTIGRKEGNTIQLTEKNVSRSHAKLDHSDDGWAIQDLGSYNGVTVNGVVIGEAVALREGDIITIGDYSLVLHDDVGKKTIDLDRPLRAANQGQPAEGEPVVASSSQDLPRLSPSEIEALSTNSPPSMADAGLGEEPASNNRAAIIGIVVVALALLGIGGYVLLGPPSQKDAGSEAAAPDGGGEAPAADAGPGETPPVSDEAGEAVVPAAETGVAATAAETGEQASETGGDAAVEEPVEEPVDEVVDEPGDETVDPPSEDPTPVEEQETGSANKPKRNTKKSITPEQADALLADARKASMAGELNKAYKLAKQSYSGKKSADALKVMAVSACKMGSASKAKAAYGKMSSGKDAVQKLCASHGIAL